MPGASGPGKRPRGRPAKVLAAGEPEGLFFLDTNILVYSFDSTAPVKQARARNLIQSALSTGLGCISSQVVQEFLNVGLRKFVRPMRPPEAEEYLRIVLGPLCRHHPDLDFYRNAMILASRHSLSWYDALVVQAGVDLGCGILYSEDLHHGSRFGSLRVIDPFRD